MARQSDGCDPGSCTEALELVRHQRHDFINHLQIIHSLVQLGRTQKALEYIERISRDQDWLGNLLEEYKETHVY